MYRIRKATTQDSDTIYSFICELESAVLDIIRFRESYFHNLESPDILYLVAENENGLAGFISAHGQWLLHHSEKVYEIQELFVTPDQRNNGIGSLLVNAVRKELEKEPCELLEVACGISRTGAHRFYLRENFRQSHYKFTWPAYSGTNS